MSDQTQRPPFSIHQLRVMDAMAASTGFMPREVIDQSSGLSIGPNHIARLLFKLCCDAIETKTIDVIGLDGRVAQPGSCKLTVEALGWLVPWQGDLHG